MTRDQIEELQIHLLGMDQLTPKLAELINHAKDLQIFVGELTDWLASGPSPMKTATYYQIQARAQALRKVIELPRVITSPLVMY